MFKSVVARRLSDFLMDERDYLLKTIASVAQG